MIEMPLFRYEEWYLKQIKCALVDGRHKNQGMIGDFYHVKRNEINGLLKEIVCEEDFSNYNEEYTLFEKLILAPYTDLEKIYKKIYDSADEMFTELITDKNGKPKRIIKKKWLSVYKLYDKLVGRGINVELIKKYGIKCCPYCNENYIVNRMKKNGKTYAMAQLDHFYPRDKFPIFSVSLYNIIPVCATCNHIKSIYEIGISPHDHTRDFSHMKISYIPTSGDWIDDAKKIKVIFEYDSEDADFKEGMKHNLEEMGIMSSYGEHADYVQEILKKAQIYGAEVRSNLLNDFPELFSSDEEVLRIVFGNYIETKDLLKRPLSKLTQDILREIGVIV